MARVALLLALLGAASLVSVMGQNVATITIEYDNRGSKVMDKSVNAKIIGALATSVFQVPASQVAMVGGLGQSSLFNHRSTVSYTAVGPTTNGKSPYANCQAAIKSSLFSSSTAYKAIKKVTDSWMPGDKVKVERAVCSPAGAVATGH